MSKKYTNNNFYGSIDGKNCNYYYKRTRETKNVDVETNIENVNEILGTEVIDGVEFYDEFWTKVFIQNDEDEKDYFVGGVKLSELEKEDDIYSSSNIAITLEAMGSLILAGDRKKDNDNYVKVYHSGSMFKKALDEENAMRHILDNSPNGKYSVTNELDDFFVLANQTNYKMEKRFVKLNDNDLAKLVEEYKDDTLVMGYYNAYLDMKAKLKEINKKKAERGNLTAEESSRRKIIRDNIYSLKQDIIDSISHRKQEIRFKCPLPDSGCHDLSQYDEKDPQHIKYALLIDKENLDIDNDLFSIVQDLDKTISLCEFTEQQEKVLTLYRRKASVEEIARELVISHQAVSRHIDAIVKVISDKNWELYEDWYYTFIAKGKYKKCKKCGEVKLISRFDKEKKGVMGVKATCRECRKK